MAPNFRNSNRRQNRTGYVDHDVFEGLPVRHWRRDYVTVAPPPTQENVTSQNDVWAVELPHGMPKDSHLLPQHSQDLLRAARSGRIYKRPAPVEEEEVDPEAILGEKPEKKEDESRDKGFTAKAWKQIPRHMEGPDIEYLAKRRKGLITISKAAVPVPTLTKATVRKTDAAGNSYVQDVIVPKGQQVEGDVISTTTIPDPAAAEVVAQATPPRRKGAPPKNKKMKGPGRGRKKKLVPPTSVPEAAPGNGLAQSVEETGVAAESSGIKTENGAENGSVPPLASEDTEMADGSMAASDDEGGEDGEDGDEGDDDEGSVSAQDSPSKPARTFSPNDLPHMKEIPDIGSKDTDMSDIDDLPGPPLPKLESAENSGSPLKHVALSTSNVASSIKLPEGQSLLPSDNPLPEASHETAAAETAVVNEIMQQEVAETAPSTIPSPPPEPTMTEVIAAVEARQEEEEEEEMLLDIIETINTANVSAPPEPEIAHAVPQALEPVAISPESKASEVVKEDPQVPEIPAHVPEEVPLQEKVPTPEEVPVQEKVPVEEEALVQEAVPLQEEIVKKVEEQPADDEGDFPDLLGGLEEQLKEPQALPAADPPISEEDKAEQESVKPEGE